jgi:hypothetical protein
MNMKRWLLAAGLGIAGVATAAGLVGGASATTAPPGVGGTGAPPEVGATAVTVPTDNDTPLTGESRDRAMAAAVAHVGGGEVTDTELGDGGAAYGVEVRKPDGSQVEVNLDQGYAVTSMEADDDGPGDDDEPDEDADDVNDDDGPNDPDDDPGEPPADPND